MKRTATAAKAAITLLTAAGLIALAGCSSSDSAQPSTSRTSPESGHAQWSYEGATGPMNWGSLSPAYAECSTGQLQSPIDIVDPTVTNDANPKLAYTATTAKVSNSGHDIGMSSPPGNTMATGGVTYTLEKTHIHTPSENQIAGKSFAGEFHFVHASDAKQVAVIGQFVEVGARNDAWEPFIAAAKQQPAKGIGPQFPINWGALIPKLSGTIQFPGSLTTPPCTQGLAWFVNPTPITMSQDQLDTLTSIYNNNARPIQPLNGRTVAQDAK